MNQVILVWALWAAHNNNEFDPKHLREPYVAAYFADQTECERVQDLLQTDRWTRCIQASYLLPAHK